MIVRKDKHGLHIRSRWFTGKQRHHPAYRPGTFNGCGHVWDTSDGGLSEGDNVKTRHVLGAPFVQITTPSGQVVFWGSYNRKEGDFPETKD